MPDQMRAITLARRPNGDPVSEDFAFVEAAVPVPEEGEIVVACSHLSLDPYMRGRMDDVKSYAPSVEIGGIMTGQGVGRVIASRAEGFSEGDLVTGMTGWASHARLPGKEARALDDRLPPSTALGVLGMPGFTAWVGLQEFAAMQAGETLAVAAATGPVGSMVGQLARAAGLRSIGIAGGAEKTRLLTETFGFDAALDHRSFDDARGLRAALADAAPDGIDIYWENVGGTVLEATLPLMNTHGRIVVCGTIAWYGGVDLSGPDKLPGLWRAVLVKRLSINGMIVFDHWHRFREFTETIGPKVAAGEIAYLEDIAHGLDAMPEAFIGMLKGANTGKQIVAL
ncbi:NADP-dependent oxidoreductase [Cognatishimia sp. F0-27]|uniref:NADP-dependent oxidoreductase n=1 Tax=Cognatishimia sp. F0-27 TaxID=2816855 RepID=UPI001D0CAD38|nr:NADP-dependent oxidoreductase [Cognatishimia sp. F0-27]MCC1491668.1 NADP-dependent oxidoreductase [Cognatishimia sp. F0-27]